MTQDEIINSYIPIVDFIAQTYGRNCEVILHDIRKLENSIVAIRNNHITGRNVGGTLTDFALKIIHDKAYENQEYIVNYMGRTSDGKKVLRSSTYFIKDENNEIIGLLCLNIDVTLLSQAQEVINDLVSGVNGVEQKKTVQQENFSTSLEEMVYTMVNSTIAEYGIEPSRMSIEEKKDIVNNLNARGVFLLKGAVTEVARLLEVSEQTIYRYLKELQ